MTIITSLIFGTLIIVFVGCLCLSFLCYCSRLIKNEVIVLLKTKTVCQFDDKPEPSRNITIAGLISDLIANRRRIRTAKFFVIIGFAIPVAILIRAMFLWYRYNIH